MHLLFSERSWTLTKRYLVKKWVLLSESVFTKCYGIKVHLDHLSYPTLCSTLYPDTSSSLQVQMLYCRETKTMTTTKTLTKSEFSHSRSLKGYRYCIPGNPPVHIISHFNLITFACLVGWPATYYLTYLGSPTSVETDPKTFAFFPLPSQSLLHDYCCDPKILHTMVTFVPLFSENPCFLSSKPPTLRLTTTDATQS